MPFIYLLLILVLVLLIAPFIFSFWGLVITLAIAGFFLVGYFSEDKKEKRRMKKENANNSYSLNEASTETSTNETKKIEREKSEPTILGFDAFDHLEPDVTNSPISNVSNKNKVKVVGTTFTNAKQILRNVIKDKGDIWNINGYANHDIILSLVPEPENKYDPNAIAVYSKYDTPERARISRSGRIGYLPKGIGLKIDEEIVVKANIKEGYGNFGVTVDLSELNLNNDLS